MQRVKNQVISAKIGLTPEYACQFIDSSPLGTSVELGKAVDPFIEGERLIRFASKDSQQPWRKCARRSAFLEVT
jgi:hypothetical protein